MKLRLMVVAIAFGAPAAHAQSSDPCAQTRPEYTGGGYGGGGNPLSAIVGLIGQQRRDSACAEQRRAQWAEYNERQKAAKDAADQQAAARQAQQLETEHQTAALAAAKTAAQAAAHARREAAAIQTRQLRAQRDAQTARAAQTAQADHRLRYVALLRAEASPDNLCRRPEAARGVIQAWNSLDTMKAAGLTAIDIEHLTTTTANPATGALSCHGVFVTNQGFRVAGTATVKKNVAGDPMFVWARDRDQTLADYQPPPALNATSPELDSEVHVQTVATHTQPPDVLRE